MLEAGNGHVELGDGELRDSRNVWRIYSGFELCLAGQLVASLAAGSVNFLQGAPYLVVGFHNCGIVVDDVDCIGPLLLSLLRSHLIVLSNVLGKNLLLMLSLLQGVKKLLLLMLYRVHKCSRVVLNRPRCNWAGRLVTFPVGPSTLLLLTTVMCLQLAPGIPIESTRETPLPGLLSRCSLLLLSGRSVGNHV